MLLLWGVLGAALGQDLKKRFEFEYSFKGSFLNLYVVYQELKI